MNNWIVCQGRVSNVKIGFFVSDDEQRGEEMTSSKCFRNLTD